MTGDVRGAGTNSKIHMVMHGTKGMKNSGKVMGRWEKERGNAMITRTSAVLIIVTKDFLVQQ